ncbi:MAG: TatD family hydrolase [Myxococcota bacterium]
MIAVGASGVSNGAKEAIALAERFDTIYATAGIHPHEAEHADATQMALIDSLLSHPKVVALGKSARLLLRQFA